MTLPFPIMQVANSACEGLEHPWRVSIDQHKLWIVANDGGFVQPQEVDVCFLSNSMTFESLTVLGSDRDECRAGDGDDAALATC